MREIQQLPRRKANTDDYRRINEGADSYVDRGTKDSKSRFVFLDGTTKTKKVGTQPDPIDLLSPTLDEIVTFDARRVSKFTVDIGPDGKVMNR